MATEVKDIPKDINNLDKMLGDIMNEKNKLEKLTKKIGERTSKGSKTHKVIPNVESPPPQSKPNAKPKAGYGGDGDGDNNQTETELKAFKIELNGEHEIKQQLQIEGKDFKNISKPAVNKILDLLKNYVNMDKSFRLKHESLKTLYSAYLDLYKKYKEQGADSSKSANNVANETKHSEMLKNIHTEMKENNSNLYRERLMILKKIKDTPEIDHGIKNKICGRLIAIFKSPPIPEYKPLQLLRPSYEEEEKISVNELDNAYLQKHNELLTVFKAYQNLYNKVLNYKEQLEKYKQLPTGSNISRCQMEKMLKDQRFVMDMIDKMQDNLADKKIISDSEKVLITPVASNPDNMNAFNNTMREQIRHIIDRNVDINPGVRTKIEDLLSQYKECDSNDQFCNAGRKLILLKKM
jgi:hypothetical protein